MTRRRTLAILAGLALASGALARSPDGTLDVIRVPNNGMPVITVPGGTFEAVLAREAELRLVGAHTYPLETVWRDLPGGMLGARCTTPDEAVPGEYALETAGEGFADRNTRSVYVLEAFPEVYRIAHITDTHIGSDRHPRSSEDIFRDVLDAINRIASPEEPEGNEEIDGEDDPVEREPPVMFVLVTGDLTEGGTADEFRTFVQLLDRCALPTFVCPGNHDRSGADYENTFGPVTYHFRFGRDGYLSFDTKDYIVADELGPQDADLEVFRRRLIASRWTIGFTHRYEPDMGLRSQTILFVDDPLDILLFGHKHRENRKDERVVPWGTTPIVITPAAIDGALRLVEVGEYRIVPGEVEYPVAIE